MADALVNAIGDVYRYGMRALELYCGIGGFAAAVDGRGVEIVAALDASSHVVETYNRNWQAVARQRNVLQLSHDDFAAYQADLWWMSPPCAPYTRRGNQLDLSDHRTESYLRVVDAIAALRPPIVAMENVEGFADSEARQRLVDVLDGYRVQEWVLCPTRLGVPNKRPRYYLVAATGDFVPAALPAPVVIADWSSFLEEDVDERFVVPDDIVARYGSGFHVIEPGEPYTTCFTGSYGKSWNFTGSYFRRPDGRLRRFTPREVLNFLGFPRDFSFPETFDDRQCYKYAGNSLSVPAVQCALEGVLEGMRSKKVRFPET